MCTRHGKRSFGDQTNNAGAWYFPFQVSTYSLSSSFSLDILPPSLWWGTVSPPVSFTRCIPRLLFAVLLTGDTLEPMTRRVFILNNCKAAVKGAPADSKDSSHPDLDVPRGSAAAHQLCASSLASHSTHLRPRRGKNLIPRTGMSHLTEEEEMRSPAVQERRGRSARKRSTCTQVLHLSPFCHPLL